VIVTENLFAAPEREKGKTMGELKENEEHEEK
jgi:hypothetical protein